MISETKKSFNDSPMSFIWLSKWTDSDRKIESDRRYLARKSLVFKWVLSAFILFILSDCINTKSRENWEKMSL